MNEHKPSQLNIKSAEARKLASEIAAGSDLSLTDAVLVALREKAVRVRQDKAREERLRRIDDLVRAYQALPDRDTRSADEIIGYDENGLPT